MSGTASSELSPSMPRKTSPFDRAPWTVRTRSGSDTLGIETGSGLGAQPLRPTHAGELPLPAAFACLPVPQSDLDRCLAASWRVGAVPETFESEDPSNE